MSGIDRPCACTPGSLEDGWSEDRCAACLDAEREVWRAMMDRLLGYQPGC